MQFTLSTLLLAGILSLNTTLIITDGVIAQANSSSSVTVMSKQQNSLPNAVANAVTQHISNRTGVPAEDLRIVKAQQKTWSDSCLGLGKPNELCAQVLVEGWQVVVSHDSHTWVYHTDSDGSQLRVASGNLPETKLPDSVAQAVLFNAAQRLDTSISNLRIIEAEQKTWSNGCLGLARPDEFCTLALVEGWRVTVSSGDEGLVYRTDSSGNQVRLESNDDLTANLPRKIEEKVLRVASQQSGLRLSSLGVLEAKQRTWDGCLGLNPGENFACPEIAISGWQVTVGAGEQRWVYHTNSDGSEIRLNIAASRICNFPVAMKPIQIPTRELPPPLSRNAVFRVISSGGITGRSEETILFRNGRIIRKLVVPNGQMISEQNYRLPRQQVQEFYRLLQEQDLEGFDRLSFPAPAGAADYITMTVTTPVGTTRYVDLSQEQLPEDLQRVMEAWNRLMQSALK